MNDQVAEVSATYLIEAARNAVPEGYKQTEVGIIPEDWDVQAGRQLFTKIQDGTHFSPKISGGEYLYITSKNIKFGFLDFKSAEYIDRFQHEAIYNRCDVKKHDILLTKDGAKTGNAALNTLDEPFSLLSSVAFLRLDKNKDCPAFFLQQILSDEFQNYIKEEMSGNAITRLTLKKINGLKFYVPCKIEQATIANALSDVDALISELEKLIAKKQAIKTATMQQLLTGRTRLPQFALHEDGTPKGYKQSELGEIPEDWELTQLSSIATVRGGKRLPKGKSLSNRPNNYPYVRVTDMIRGGVDASNLLYVPDEIAPLIKNYRIYSGELFISVAGTLGIVGRITEHLDGANLTENANRICNINADYNYILYCLSSKRIQDDITSQSTIGAQPKLALGKIESFLISLPFNKIEQAAIATVLSEMDEEVLALEQRLGKTRQIKQGMMQELLTGKTRLMAPTA